MSNKSDEEVRFTVKEFAFLVKRSPRYIAELLREQKLKGYQTCKNAEWLIPEGELAKFWGNLYGLPVERTDSGERSGQG